jgi:hypothetical protein
VKQSSGLGKSIPNQDWKKMYLTRRALDQRWKDGKAAAIYLQGHQDSVYCSQFDEYVPPFTICFCVTLTHLKEENYYRLS